MTQNVVPGVLMRLVEPKQVASSNETPPSAQTPCPNAEKSYTAVANDGERPSRLTLYTLSDITPLLSSSQFYKDDMKANPDLTISWVVCEFINGRDAGAPTTQEPSTTHALAHKPADESKLVINGSTPRPDKETDYHEWYDIEHGPGLATVPGWNAMRRYRLRKTYGEIHTANFYGFNYYDKESGLGGPIWEKATKTEWTFRIRGNAAKPNIRRVWRIQSQ